MGQGVDSTRVRGGLEFCKGKEGVRGKAGGWRLRLLQNRIRGVKGNVAECGGMWQSTKSELGGEGERVSGGWRAGQKAGCGRRRSCATARGATA